MVHINWQPSPRELRQWGITILIGTALSGCIFYFLLDQPFGARLLWLFGVLSFATSLTGTKAGLPFYLLWMSIVWMVSHTLGLLALAVVFYLVVTPIGILARMLGRDRLNLRRPQPGAISFWEKSPTIGADRFDRPF